MATLASKPGITGATTLSIPKEWDATWFRNFINNALKGADVRNAVGSNGITVSGTIASPYASIKIGAGPIVIPSAPAGQATLTVQGTANGANIQTWTDGTNVAGLFTATSPNAVAFGTTSASALQLWANGASRVTISTAGAVTISTPVAANTLTVNAASGFAAISVIAATNSFASLLLKSGQTGTRSFELTSGVTVDNFDIIDDTLSASRFRISAVDNTIKGYGPNTAGLVDMTPDFGQFVGTLTGCTTAPTATFTWRKFGALVVLNCPQLQATSNSTSCTITGLPAAIQPAAFGSQWMSFPIIRDNGILVLGSAFVTVGSGTLTLSNGIPGNQASFTASGTKGIGGSCTIFWLLT